MTQIRQANRSDAARLNRALARLSRDLSDTHRATDAQIEAALAGQRPIARALLAEDGDDVTGLAFYSPGFSTARGGAWVYVSDLWVCDSRRGKGLGRRLLRAVMQDASSVWNAKWLKLFVYDHRPETRAFYENLGFVPTTNQSELSISAETLRGPT